MIYRIRLLIAVLLVEAGLGYLWWSMLQPGVAGGNRMLVEGAPARIGEIMGSVMGGVLGLAFLLYFVARANDRRRVARR
jgi:hypothetical protein